MLLLNYISFHLWPQTVECSKAVLWCWAVLCSFNQVLFACAEALHAHGYSNEACRLAVELARDLLANPPDLKVEQPQTKVSRRPSRNVHLLMQCSEVLHRVLICLLGFRVRRAKCPPADRLR